MTQRKMMGKLDIVEEIQNDDGTWTLVFEVNDDFKEWFKEYQELKRWSHKRFQKVLHEALLRLEFDEGRNSKWYDCAHCDAGYPDQECTCEEE